MTTPAVPGATGRALLLLLPLALGACQTLGIYGMFHPPEMAGPKGNDLAAPKQDTEAGERQALAERESLPEPPPPPLAASWSNLGTVPPKPDLPTPEQIRTGTLDLAAEQKTGAALIARQAEAPTPQTLPKPVSAGTPPASPEPALPVVSPPIGPYLSGAAGLEGVESQLNSADNQFLLPQSQVIEQTDRLPPDAR